MKQSRQRGGKRYQRAVNGILVLDKSQGLSSNQALQQVRRLLGARKGGHTGNLDPLATGVLPLCFGEATKFGQFLLDADKGYLATAVFGMKTDTGDRTGQVVETSDVPVLDESTVDSVFRQFTGVISQVPPMYSALRQGGKRLYELAREGKTVERPAREVTIHGLERVELSGAKLVFRVSCSKGTYVRTLIEDIAVALGTVGHMAELRREQSGLFTAQQQVTLDGLQALAETSETPELFESILREQGYLLPLDAGLQDLPKICLEKQQSDSLILGQAVTIPDLEISPAWRIYLHDGRFAGVGKTEEGQLRPTRLVSREALEAS